MEFSWQIVLGALSVLSGLLGITAGKLWNSTRSVKSDVSLVKQLVDDPAVKDDVRALLMRELERRAVLIGARLRYPLLTSIEATLTILSIGLWSLGIVRVAVAEAWWLSSSWLWTEGVSMLALPCFVLSWATLKWYNRATERQEFLAGMLGRDDEFVIQHRGHLSDVCLVLGAALIAFVCGSILWALSEVSDTLGWTSDEFYAVSSTVFISIAGALVAILLCRMVRKVMRNR